MLVCTLLNLLLEFVQKYKKLICLINQMYNILILKINVTTCPNLTFTGKQNLYCDKSLKVLVSV